MKPKSHEMQLLKTVVHGGEQKTPLQLNTVLFLWGGGGNKLDFQTSLKRIFF